MPTSILAYRKIIESYMQNAQLYEPVGNQTANWSTQAQTKLCTNWSVGKYEVKKEERMNLTPLNILATPWAKPRL